MYTVVHLTLFMTFNQLHKHFELPNKLESSIKLFKLISLLPKLNDKKSLPHIYKTPWTKNTFPSQPMNGQLTLILILMTSPGNNKNNVLTHSFIVPIFLTCNFDSD